MKKALYALLLAGCTLGLSTAATAADEKKPAEEKKMTAQQSKMGDCNKQAGEKALKGDDRKKFMSTCLSNKPAEEPKMTQQDKMKMCNQTAAEKNLKGDERKAHMKSCLSNK